MLGTATITSQADLTSAVSSSKTFQAGDTVTVTYVREGKVYTTELTFGSTLDKPEEEAVPQSAPQQPDASGEGYGDMEDFFNQFFGGYYGQRAS